MARASALLRRFRRSERGLAAIELAMAAPFLGLLLLGGYDLSRFISIRSGVDKVGFSVADVTSQFESLTNQDLQDTVFKVVGKSVPAFKDGVNGVIILTSLRLDGAAQKVRWQCRSSAGTWVSKVGVPGAVAEVPEGLLADGNDNIIISEVFYKFDPVFSRFFTNGFDMYSRSLYRPRLGNLSTSPCP